MQNDTSIVMLDTSLIVPNKYQPRKIFDENALNKLADSIKNYGIINPILVRKKDDKYEIIAGERRFRASKKIGLNEIPAIIKNADEQQMAELALIENLERQNLSPIEEAKSYEEIMRIGNQTQASLANKLGKSQSSIANKIRLLSLPQEIQDAVSNKKIGERHARSLLSIENKDRQLEILNKIITEKLTVKETEEIINNQEISEEEIKKAISDIMKSLNIQEDNETKEDKKEEKEDDNMNNGNFFPNYDNNNAVNNNASLNMMNMQSMNQQAIEPTPEVVMPTVNQPIVDPTMIVPNSAQMEPTQQEQFMQQNPIDMQPQMSIPMVDQPLFNQNATMTPVEPVVYNQPMMDQNQMVATPIEIAPEMQSYDNPTFNNVPLFGQQAESIPQEQFMQQNPIDMQPQISIPMVDQPLFNQNATMTPVEPVVVAPLMQEPIQMTEPQIETPIMVEQQFEVPVVAEIPNQQEISSIATNKLQELENFLNTNGYQFKLYGNENNDCIIIEVPRN